MNWLARLKNGKTPERDATKTTETLFVVSVAPTLAPLQKIEVTSAAATAPAPTPQKATVVQETFPLHTDPVADDPDRCCWPHSTAMTGREIDTFKARLARFTDKGTGTDVGEALADKLVIRDRESDDRRLCLECRHLAGYGPGSWRCGNWQAAGTAIKARDAGLPADLVWQLQRCDGFITQLTSITGRTDHEHDRN